MILTAHQPVYLPWLGLFHKIALADMFVSFDQVQYLPKDWNNRNKIKTSNGPVWLTVPVLKKGHREKRICEIEINNTVAWGRKHWQAIKINYSKSQYFKKYADFFEDVYKRDWVLLTDLNFYMLKWFLKTIGISIPVVSAGKYDFQGEKNALVLDMCKKLGAENYIFGALGKDYADVRSFEREKIKVYFQDYKHPRYPQQHGEFVSHISVIDLLFNCGPKSFDVIMSGNVTRDNLLKV